MNNYIWAAVIVVLFLFTSWRMKIEYQRGFRNGARKILGEWKQYMVTLEDDDNDVN